MFLREHFNSEGKPKHAYRTKMAADLQADKLTNLHDRGDYESYQCSICHLWHVGRAK